MKSESHILKEVQLAAHKLGIKVFRNNRGMFYTMGGTKIRAGLEVNGSSDLIGWDKNGKFCAIEVKSSKGRPSEDQLKFIENVRKSGGFACIVKNVDELQKSYCEYNSMVIR